MSDIKDACSRWINGFDFIPGSVFRKLALNDNNIYCYDSDSLRLVGSPLIECAGCGALYEGNQSIDELREDKSGCSYCEYNQDGEDWRCGWPQYAFPCGWDTLFAPRDMIDIEWFERNTAEVCKLGFFIFSSEDFGLMLGLDCGGFDFYQSFWIPLYKLRGLEWHLYQQVV
ncbi:MAG: hypothetical protein MJB14_09170 [Spirochaetes bacterium]|nr:hypothetical protein [Spirochaetota bacterium]